MPKPKFIEPMKAQAVTAVPVGDWRLEVKFDGYRALAVLDHGVATLWSRNHKAWKDRFETVRAGVAALPCHDAILDGEIVALDAEGRSSFQQLQNALDTDAPDAGPLKYYLFDLLRLDGVDLTREPIEKRQAALARLLKKARDPLALSHVFTDQTPADLLAAVRERGLEGIIAKAPGSLYESGRRSGQWLKCRLVREQEFVIGGLTPPQGSRTHFGALLVGTYDHDGRLIYAGKVGTGFNDRTLRDLDRRLRALERKTCPFDNLPVEGRSRYGQTINAAAMREITWVTPKLVAQVKFAEWTQDGRLRQPAFLGLRTDKPATGVHRDLIAD